METVTEKSKRKIPVRRQWRRIAGFVVLGLLVTLFVAVLIQFVTPYFVHRDDIDALFSLSGEDCAPPCFLDITPGITTLDEARERLETVSWISDIQIFETDHYIFWRTNAERPTYLGDTASANADSTRVIYDIVVPTRIPFGAYLLNFGYPEMDINEINALYPDIGLGFNSLRCPDAPHEYWYADSIAIFYHPDSHPVFNTTINFFPRTFRSCWM